MTEERIPLAGSANAKLYDSNVLPKSWNQRHPEEVASWFSRITFNWLGTVVKQGSKQAYDAENLLSLRAIDTSMHVHSLLSNEWMNERDFASKPSLVRAIRKSFGFNMYIAGLCKFLGDLCGFVGPICLNGIIRYVEDPSTAYFLPKYYGFILCGGMFLFSILGTILLHQHHHLVIREGIHARTAITELVFEKSLIVSPYVKQRYGTGRILNHQSTDTSRIMDVFYFIHYTWASPLQLAIAILLLVRFIGVSALAGLGVMLILLPMGGKIAGFVGRLSKMALEQTDKRVKLLSEVLRGIRVVKFYAWEDRLKRVVDHLRATELSYIRSMLLCNSVNQVTFQAGPILIALASFSAYAWIEGHALTPDKAFTAISLFNLFRLPTAMLPRIFSLLVQANISIKRLEEYLLSEEIQRYINNPESIEQSSNAIQELVGKKSKTIALENASFLFDPEDKSINLDNINLILPERKLTMVVGAVGSGKSSLVSAMLGELYYTSGTVYVNGSVAYVGQQAWILNTTIKENILFGKPYNEKRFNHIIRICALHNDLKTFPAGIETEIGERGVNMSGGQKQRISIARAVYADKDIYIFDDCLSALDSHVGKHIFEECIQNALQEKTRILVTHAVQFASDADKIVLVKNMKITEQGSYQELLEKKGEFTLLLHEGLSKKPEEEETKTEDEKTLKNKRSSIEDINGDGKLVVEEERVKGSVDSSVYKSYFISCGIFAVSIVGAFLLLNQAFQVGTMLWLTHWTSASDADEHMSYYLKYYGLIALGSIITIFVSDALWKLSGLRASRIIHDTLFQRMLRAPMQFYDTTPLGRIINRFSNDINVIDQKLNATTKSSISITISVLSALIIQCLASPYILLVIAPSMILYYLLQRFYRRTSRELQRLDSISKSPIYAHFEQTLSDLSTLRAYQRENSFIHESQKRLDQNTRAFLLLNLVNRWLGVRLEFLGAIITLSVALFIVSASKGSVVKAAVGGLILTYSQSITDLLNWMVRTSIDTENQMNAVERTDEYTRVEQEAPVIISTNRPPLNWPNQGAIEFYSVSARYRPGLDLVIKNVSFKIKGGEKVGICGRTGSGKSTLLLLLTRMLECCDGQIVIDNIDSKRIGLYDLRSKLSIIPQEPVLFAQTIRFNLDPFDEHSDDELWRALEKSKLAVVVRSIPNMLDGMIVEGGDNFSTGERQLFCLARALIRNSSILLLDEATASVDQQTDKYIQERIREDFQNRTVVAIAHRLDTIMDYDKILVMDHGQVQEYGSPKQLLEEEKSALRSLAGNDFSYLLHKAHGYK